MSIRKELFEQIENAGQPDADGWIETTSYDIASRMGRDATTISKMLASLAQHGNIEARKGEDGRVNAIRVLRAPRAYRKGEDSPRAARRSESSNSKKHLRVVRAFGQSTPTPLVDKYAQAKEAYEKVLPSLGDFAKVEWREQPIAEEALALKTHNEALISQMRELRNRAESMERELDFLRKANDSRLRQGLKSAGVLVEHGG